MTSSDRLKRRRYKKIALFIVLASFVAGCTSSSSSSSSSGGTHTDALAYAKFGEIVNNAIPDGLKTGVSASMGLFKELSGACLDSYTDCPYLTDAGGGDSPAGSIIMRLWGIDYDNECTDELLADGTCFTCPDCGPSGMTYIKPTMLADPTACGTMSTMEGRYVNYGVDPCFFDAGIAQISNIAECETVQGGDVDISSVVPWFASWGLSQTVNFSSYNSQGNGGGIWWTINNGASGVEQYFLTLTSNWLYVGFKDTANDKFLFLGTSSPAYNEAGAASGGYTTGVSISAYAGTLSNITTEFEAIQVRDQPPYDGIERLKSNGTYLWYQWWPSEVFPDTPADVETLRNSPFENRCVLIGDSITTSMYVPLENCFVPFGVTDLDGMNDDDNFTLKIIDRQTASSIDFGTALTPTTETSCLEEVPAE